MGSITLLSAGQALAAHRALSSVDTDAVSVPTGNLETLQPHFPHGSQNLCLIRSIGCARVDQTHGPPGLVSGP